MIKPFKLAFIILCILPLFSQPSNARNSDEEPEDAFKLSGIKEDDIKTGTRQYLVYFKEKDTGKIKMLSLWNRTTALVEHNGAIAVETKQQWYSDDIRFNREIYSLNRLENFSPLQHITKNTHSSETKAFKFYPKVITHDKSVEINQLTDFSMNSNEYTLNWELDMETFALLPLAKGKVFSLNFYHPGSPTPPQNYVYKVIGEDILKDLQNNEIHCWQLRINYNDKDHAIFWLDKKDGQLIKMEESWGNIMKYKVQLRVASGLDTK